MNLVASFASAHQSGTGKIRQVPLDCSSSHADRPLYFSKVERFVTVTEEESEYGGTALPNNAQLSLLGVVPISGFKIPYKGTVRQASLLGTSLASIL